MSEHENKRVSVYEKFASKTRELFSQSREKTLASLERALESAREQLVKAGELTQEESQEFKAYLRRDLEQTSRDFQSWSDNARKNAHPSALQAGFLELTGHIAENARNLFDRLAEWADTTAVYHTGEIAAAGTFRCRACNADIHFKGTGHLPPCPKCHATQYRRVE